jgi:hypothetical protein
VRCRIKERAMATAASDNDDAGGLRKCSYRPRTWSDIVDLALILWIVRVPLCALFVGFVLLCLVPQAQDLLVDLIEHWYRIALFLIVLVFAWASPTHYAARLLLDTDERYRAHVERKNSEFIACWETLIPRLLGALTFVFVLISAERSIVNLPRIEDSGVISAATNGLRWFQVATAIMLLLFIWYTAGRESLRRLLQFRPIELKIGLISRLLRRVGIEPRIDSSNVGPLMLVVLFLFCAGIMMFAPNRVADLFPRGIVVPVILGAWLPFLSFMSGLGRRHRAPLIAAVACLVVALSFLLGDNHSVRRINAEKESGRKTDISAMALTGAVKMWMDANDCTNAPLQCPRPIIVATAGGASRAGFFTASVIGYLLDTAKEHRPDLDEAAVARRLFAISGVSGGSVGAVMTAAALARANDNGQQPCVERTPSLWYGGKVNNWRDCLEALMSGDFLTAVSVGLVFRDTVRFGWWQDRAETLEKSWEDRFAELTGADRDDWRDRCPGDLRCPFLMLRPRPLPKAQPQSQPEPKLRNWLPLLVLNGVSATTGRRIATSPLKFDYEPKGSCPVEAAMIAERDVKEKAAQLGGIKSAASGPTHRCAIFLETVWFHYLQYNKNPPDLFAWIQRLVVWDYLREKLFHYPELDDVRLSTAAHNSARFPIVSPPGAVRNIEHQIVDRIVDGGYFENYGAVSAMELAVAVHAIEPQLAPFVLVLSNDPEESPDFRRADAPDDAALTDVSIPIEAVANTRTSRGRLAVAELEAAMGNMNLPQCGISTAHVRVWPEYEASGLPGGTTKVATPVSMSWWLSRPIQILLHQQTEGSKDHNHNEDQIKSVFAAIASKSDCNETN